VTTPVLSRNLPGTKKFPHYLKAIRYVEHSALIQKDLKNVFHKALLAALEFCAAMNISLKPFLKAGIGIILKVMLKLN
jgi:hypothetical protein